jgi:hypothetical protein
LVKKKKTLQTKTQTNLENKIVANTYEGKEKKRKLKKRTNSK